jgi:hypothetical protein
MKRSYLTKKNQIECEKLLLEIDSMGFEVRFEMGNFKSSDCVLNQKKQLFINKHLSDDQLIYVLTQFINEQHKNSATPELS